VLFRSPISERAVVEGYRAVMRGRTTLIISHRRAGLGQIEQIDLELAGGLAPFAATAPPAAKVPGLAL